MSSLGKTVRESVLAIEPIVKTIKTRQYKIVQKNLKFNITMTQSQAIYDNIFYVYLQLPDSWRLIPSGWWESYNVGQWQIARPV